MKYVVLDRRKDGTGDWFTKEFDDPKEAIKDAERQWGYLTYSEKKKRSIIVLESVDPDEDSDRHLDGTPIWDSEEFEKGK